MSEVQRRATFAEVVGSCAFYVAFYGGSIFYVIAALAVVGFSANGFRAIASAWSRYQRTCLRRFAGITVRNEGAPLAEPALYVLKHESFFEAIDLPSLLPNPVVFAKAELLKIPLWGRVADRYGVVAVERGEGANALRAMLKAAREAKARGRPLALFPEGTRVPHGTRPPLGAGFAGLYKILAMPVVPIALASGPVYHRWWKRRAPIVIRFGETIPPGLPREEIEERVHRAINALNGNPPGQRSSTSADCA